MPVEMRKDESICLQYTRSMNCVCQVGTRECGRRKKILLLFEAASRFYIPPRQRNIIFLDIANEVAHAAF